MIIDSYLESQLLSDTEIATILLSFQQGILSSDKNNPTDDTDDSLKINIFYDLMTIILCAYRYLYWDKVVFEIIFLFDVISIKCIEMYNELDVK